MTIIGSGQIEFAELPGRRSGDPLRGVGAASSLRLSHPERTASRNAHRHPHSEEVIYVRTGSGVVYIEGEIHRVVAGDVIHVPQGAAHATAPDEDVPMELVCFFPHPNLAENIEETEIDIMKEIHRD